MQKIKVVMSSLLTLRNWHNQRDSVNKTHTGKLPLHSQSDPVLIAQDRGLKKACRDTAYRHNKLQTQIQITVHTDAD